MWPTNWALLVSVPRRLRQGIPPVQIYESLGLDRYCCRTNLMNPSKYLSHVELQEPGTVIVDEPYVQLVTKRRQGMNLPAPLYDMQVGSAVIQQEDSDVGVLRPLTRIEGTSELEMMAGLMPTVGYDGFDGEKEVCEEGELEGEERAVFVGVDKGEEKWLGIPNVLPPIKSRQPLPPPAQIEGAEQVPRLKVRRVYADRRDGWKGY